MILQEAINHSNINRNKSLAIAKMVDQYDAIFKANCTGERGHGYLCGLGYAEYVNQVLSQYEQPFLSYAALSVFHSGKLYRWQGIIYLPHRC